SKFKPRSHLIQSETNSTKLERAITFLKKCSRQHFVEWITSYATFSEDAVEWLSSDYVSRYYVEHKDLKKQIALQALTRINELADHHLVVGLIEENELLDSELNQSLIMLESTLPAFKLLVSLIRTLLHRDLPLDRLALLRGIVLRSVLEQQRSA